MLSPETLEKLEKLATDVAVREGCVLYDLSFAGGQGGRALRVFIDREGGPVSVEDCANVSRGLNLILDVEDIIPGGNYNLEVSSPGLDRVLRKPWHFEKAAGQTVYLKTSKALETFGLQNKRLKSAKQIEEVVQTANAEGVTLKVEEETITVPYSAIEKAKIVFQYAEPGKKKILNKKN